MFYFAESVLLDSPEDSLEIRHLILKGSNFDIGWKLGEIARQRHLIEKDPVEDPLRIRCQRTYLERNYPIFFERMRGIAHAYQADDQADLIDFSLLGEVMLGTGCSAVYYPPNRTISGHGIISRNLDFYVPAVIPALSKPYIVEMYPDKGYPSISILSFQLMGEALEGMNSEGLTVIHLADEESPLKYPMEPTYGSAVGLNELKSIQLLLDTCTTVAEAKTALLTNKHFYMFQPVHLLIADRFGNSFVWEYSHAHNQEYLVDGKNEPQIVTNFLLHRYESIQDIPKTRDEKACPYNRYRVLHEALKEHPEKFSMDFIKETNALVFMAKSSFINPPGVPIRTLLHSIYDIENRSLEVNFYLQDSINRDSNKASYFKFCLDY